MYSGFYLLLPSISLLTHSSLPGLQLVAHIQTIIHHLSNVLSLFSNYSQYTFYYLVGFTRHMLCSYKFNCILMKMTVVNTSLLSIYATKIKTGSQVYNPFQDSTMGTVNCAIIVLFRFYICIDVTLT